jgi:hypothetical protein
MSQTSTETIDRAMLADLREAMGGEAEEIGRNPEIDAVVSRLIAERQALVAAMAEDQVSVRELARRLGVSPAAISRQLRSDKDMLVGTSALLAYALGRQWVTELRRHPTSPHARANYYQVNTPAPGVGTPHRATFEVKPGGATGRLVSVGSGADFVIMSNEEAQANTPTRKSSGVSER